MLYTMWSLMVMTFAVQTAPVTPSDERGEQLLKQATATYAHANTLTADIVSTGGLMGSKGAGQGKATVILKRPNLERLESSESGKGKVTIDSDGKVVWFVLAPLHTYTTVPADPHGHSAMMKAPFAAWLFFDPDFRKTSPGAAYHLKYMGAQRVGNATYDVLELSRKDVFPSRQGSHTQVQTRKLYIGADKLIHVEESATSVQGGTVVVHGRAVYTNIRLNVPVADSTFAYSPPPDMKSLKAPSH